jgi:hypothetical protein
VIEHFWSAIQASPIVSAAQGIESAWPAGACFAGETVTLVTIPGHTYDYGSTFCSIWATYAAPALAAVMLAGWALVGIFIVLSA